MRDLSSKLRAIVRSNPIEPARELTFEPDVPDKRGVLPPPPDLNAPSDEVFAMLQDVVAQVPAVASTVVPPGSP